MIRINDALIRPCPLRGPATSIHAWPAFSLPGTIRLSLDNGDGRAEVTLGQNDVRDLIQLLADAAAQAQLSVEAA